MDSVKMVKTTDGSTPALSASKRHRADSDWTPWHDELDAERGSRRPAAILGD